MLVEVAGVIGGEDGVDRARFGSAQPSFELAEGLFDRIEVGGVGWQKPKPAARRLDQLPRAGALVDREVVENHRLAWPQRRRQDAFDVGLEDRAVERASELEAWSEAVGSECGEERHRRPAPPGNPPNHALPA